MVASEFDQPLFDLDAIPLRPKVEKMSIARDVTVQTREFGPWTLSKLDVLSAYFRMYRRVAGGGTYLDGFAGSGHAVTQGSKVMGSPLRAATSGAFRELHFMEKSRRDHLLLSAAVRELTGKQQAKITVHPRCDANEKIVELLEAKAIRDDKPCFAFLDPNSTELDWTTVEAIARYKTFVPPADAKGSPERCKVELWILVNTHQALGRLLPVDRRKYTVPPNADTLDRVFGCRDAWWPVWTATHGGPSAFAHRYKERLRTELNYRWVHAQQVVDPETNRLHYFMIHASDHPNAHSLMRSAKRDRMVDPAPLPGLGLRPELS